jgi:hypothetical protein
LNIPISEHIDQLETPFPSGKIIYYRDSFWSVLVAMKGFSAAVAAVAGAALLGTVAAQNVDPIVIQVRVVL